MEWRASHILVKSRGLADELYQRIQKGAKFEQLAKEYSTCPSRSKGGDLGWFETGKMVRPFEEAVRKMPKNRPSRPVATQFGFHIIKKTGER